MFSLLTGMALLAIFVIIVFILILALYQNLLECMKPKAKQRPARSKPIYMSSNEFKENKLRIVK